MTADWRGIFLSLVLIFLTSVACDCVVSSKYTNINTIQSNLNESCQPWDRLTESDSCTCGLFIRYIVDCVEGFASLPYCYCMSYNEEFDKTVVGYCNIRCHVSRHDPGRSRLALRKEYQHWITHRYQIVVKSRNLSEFNSETCSGLQMNRTGQMCGSCVKEYAPPVYSYSLACVKCIDYKYTTGLSTLLLHIFH